MRVVSSTILFSFLCSLLLVIFILAYETSAQPISVKYFCDQNNDRGNYKSKSTFQTNLNTLLSTLTNSNTQINYNGFYKLSYGQNTDKVYAIGLCKGDIQPDICHSCLDKARVNLTKLCPNRKEAIGWYDDETCMLRYSDRSIFGRMEIGPAYFVWNLHDAEKANRFNKVVKNLLESLTSRGVASQRKYATATAIGPSNQTIYGLVQCTPDLSGVDCSGCLHESISVIPGCCNNRIGARIVRPSCYLRYETNFEFYDPTVGAAPPPPAPAFTFHH